MSNIQNQKKTIAIIGCGLSGLLVAYNLVKESQNKNSLSITIFEKSASFPKGIAYNTQSFSHLLNVPAKGMGVVSKERSDFLNWLKSKEYNYQENDFVPRKIFGFYLEEILAKTTEEAKNKGIDFKIQNQEILAISLKKLDDKNNFTIDGDSYDHCVLASGSLMKNSSNNFWNLDLKDFLNEPEIHILGCGLTAIDAAVSLHDMNYLGKIFLHSRRTKLPQVHQIYSNSLETKSPINLQDSQLPMSQIFRKFVNNCKKSANWRATFDSFRPLTQEFWSSLNAEKQKRFLRHCARMWNIHRHRCPESQFKIIEKLLASGNLFLTKSKISENYSKKLIDCTGFDYRFKSELVNNLIKEGIVENDQLSLGITSNYRNFHITSSLNFGSLLEITSAPDIAPQAREIANKILHS